MVNLRSSISLEKRAHRIIIGILGWSILHNFIYAILLPGPGAGGRYAPMNHMLFWLTVLLGAWLIRNHLIRSMAIIAVILLASFSISYWREVYHANIDYMLNVRIPSSLYINDHYSADTMIGTTDLGPLRWYARQPAVDLIGYVNKDIVRFRKSGGSFESYVMIKKIGALYLFVSEGGLGVDTRRIMQIEDSLQFKIIEEITYSTSSEKYLLGSGAIANYTPAISIYRITKEVSGSPNSSLTPAYKFSYE